MRPVIDILAGIPSVVYGVWGVLVIVPFVGETLAPHFHIDSLGYSILAAGLVLAVMVTSLLIGPTRPLLLYFTVMTPFFPGNTGSLEKVGTVQPHEPWAS